ncbi:MAG TPA: rhomboid family intramembrane serine protease [Anaerolineales bacterium]|nr:rhomboid family intramembrane serine protease [Anaerolineales bacterium]
MIPLYDTARTRRFALITWLLVALNALVFLQEIGLGPAALERFIRTWGLVPRQLLAQPRSEWITVFSSMFVHGGWVHILSNMWILLIFGDNVEERMGGLRYLLFYLLSGVAAALLQSLVLGGSDVPMIGASGAIAGVLGAYLVLFPHARIASLVPILFIFTVIHVPATLFLMLWFLSQLFSGWFALGGVGGSGIAWWAHIGGFVFGLVAVHAFVRRRTYY